MWGLYKYRYLPFDLSVFPDESTNSKHNDRLLQLLRTLKKFIIKINATKSIIGTGQIKYLGYVVGGRGITQ